MKVTELSSQYTSGIRDFMAVNLSEANLSGINLSGANLSNADLSEANLSGAILKRINLSKAKLNVARISNGADLSGADLRRSNLSQANLQGTSLAGASLERANLNGANLCRSNLSSANLRKVELRQATLSHANLSGADLRGANLRWADLRGANLRWADLSGAKLSGANLAGANLKNANLRNVSLVHTDLSGANLIKVDWMGSDLTGAMLTGAKLHGVSRFGLKSEDVTCAWVDLSPSGDGSKIYKFTPEKLKSFFEETLPTVQINIDAYLNFDANLALASIYQQISLVYPVFNKPPSIEIKGRRTTLTFRAASNEKLFIIAYLAIFPFSDAATIRRSLISIVHALQSQNLEDIDQQQLQGLKHLGSTLLGVISKLSSLKDRNLDKLIQESSDFFQAPTHIVLTNSSSQKMDLYRHPSFGKQLLRHSHPSEQPPIALKERKLPSLKTAMKFVKEFEYPEPELINHA